MHNFGIQFSYPWLLLLLIPAVAITLFLYFRLSKRYRRTRNRITSIVLHIIIMVLAIAALSGMMFSYQVNNDENEIILLVDVSDTEFWAQEERDEFVETILSAGRYDNYKIGIVTFGFGQKYAVPLTTNVDSIYDKYKESIASNLPDTSATNIAAALTYARDLFTYPETAKIVLITDGKETDEEAIAVIRSVAAKGVRVDTAYIPSAYSGDDVQLVGVELPDYHVYVDEECSIRITVRSKAAVRATIELSDNDQIGATGRQDVDLIAGQQSFAFRHTFKTQGFHKISFKITVENDLLEENNHYNTYLYLEVFDRILILEQKEGESNNIVSLLADEDLYNVEVINVYDQEANIPASVDALRAYDQVILNNIANKDLVKQSDKFPEGNLNMPEGFVEMLYAYVNEHGGGVLTTGGDERDPVNAYDRADMYGSLYQRMLPVQAINYTPPLGVMVIVDTSGSMSTEVGGETFLQMAVAGASSCLNALSERDYFGLMTLDSDYNMVLPLTPRTQESKILAAIQSIEDANGGTVFPGAIDRAGQALRALKEVDRRHMIIVTDGGVPENQREDYEKLITTYHDTDGITLSVVGISVSRGNSPYDETTPIEQLNKESLSTYERMLRAAILGSGRMYAVTDYSELSRLMREDLNVSEIKDVNYEDFYPTAYNIRSPLLNGVDRYEEDQSKIDVQLGGFYGVKVRTTADLVLSGAYDVPIYAQWKLGKGMVGSFMFGFAGQWSAEFLQAPSGQQFIFNVVKNLMPVENIRPKEISVALKEYNYINQLSIFSDLSRGETIQGQIIDISSPEQTAISLNTVTDPGAIADSSIYVTVALNASNNYSRSNFVIKQAGVYKVSLTKYSAEGAAVAVYETYKRFSYSKEYDTFLEQTEQDLEKFLGNLATRGDGNMINDLKDPKEIFQGFQTSIHKTYDPRFLFMILAIILFLLDIAVRKFKFKWPHEIYRQYKDKKSSK